MLWLSFVFMLLGGSIILVAAVLITYSFLSPISSGEMPEEIRKLRNESVKRWAFVGAGGLTAMIVGMLVASFCFK